ncbi:MAG TPA: hypothetical protein VNV63_05245 [Nitrospiria bacterium]|nr:hypothetical protein [Nitrospiria bacterium]
MSPPVEVGIDGPLLPFITLPDQGLDVGAGGSSKGVIAIDQMQILRGT